MSQQVIAFHYTLTGPDGQQLDSSAGGEPLTFVEGTGQIIPGLEPHLSALNVGAKQRVTLAPKEAYGHRESDRVHRVARERLPAAEIKVGDQFRLGNGHQSVIATVTELTATHVTVDTNHPLAGMALTFDLEVVAKRAATPADLECCHGAHHEEQGGCCGRHH